jgi:hypothetical protein
MARAVLIGPAMNFLPPPNDTATMTLSPALWDALKTVAPKSRRSPIPFVVGAAIAVFVSVLCADASTRDFVRTQSHTWLVTK